MHETGDIVVAVTPGSFVDALTHALPPDRTIWIHPDSVHLLDGMESDSVSVIVIAEADCSEATLAAVLGASRMQGWTTFVLSESTRLDRRQQLHDAGASAVLSSRLTPDAIATLVRETLLGNLHMDHGAQQAVETVQQD